MRLTSLARSLRHPSPLHRTVFMLQGQAFPVYATSRAHARVTVGARKMSLHARNVRNGETRERARERANSRGSARLCCDYARARVCRIQRGRAAPFRFDEASMR